MRTSYRIIGIKHSGRKGVRDTPVEDVKYGDIIGSKIILEVDRIEQYKPVHFTMVNHPYYDWWDTSALLAMWKNNLNENLYLETANTIYELQKIKD